MFCKESKKITFFVLYLNFSVCCMLEAVFLVEKILRLQFLLFSRSRPDCCLVQAPGICISASSSCRVTNSQQRSAAVELIFVGRSQPSQVIWCGSSSTRCRSTCATCINSPSARYNFCRMCLYCAFLCSVLTKFK